jgi:sialate O-acetylesterase
MQWSVNASNDPDLEKLAAKFPNIRMINFPQVGTQDPIASHDDRRWMVCNPENLGGFSAVGYFFARQLHLTIDVPIGMINNAWGGSACEAWVNRDVLKANEKFAPLLARWEAMEKQVAELSANPSLNDDQKKQLEGLKRQMSGNARPANIYNGVLKSHIGYTIRGAIWYQGESNAGRAYQYRDLFPTMISNWRQEWGQGDFPFYWVQLADFKAQQAEPGESDWAELREAQTMTMSKLSHTGEAVIIDIGEGKDIHPKNKVDVGRRLARWALANEYGVKIPFHSPQYAAMEKQDGKIVLSFNHVDGGWRPFDVPQPVGFAIAGDDHKFVWADAKILQDGRVEVSSAKVPNPVAVRYGWADNPVCNMFSGAGLPLTPFRTDDWPGVTVNNN